MTTPLITDAELAALGRQYHRAEMARVKSPDDAALEAESVRCSKVYANRLFEAKRQRRA